MAAKIKGITLEIGGDTKGLTKALGDVNKESRDIQGELKKVEKALQIDPKNTELLKEKQKLLNSEISLTGDKLKVLKNTKDKIDKEMADGTEYNEKQYRRLQTEIVQAKQALKDLQSQSKKTNDDISGVTASNEKFSKFKSTLGKATKGGVAFATAIGTAAVGLSELEENTREYREDMNKLEAAFKSSGHTVTSAKKTYSEFYNILGESDRAVEAVNHLAKLTSNQQELSEWTTIAAGVTATFGDSLPIEGLTEAANETAKVGQVTGVLADALNWVGISEDSFNEKLKACSTEQERASLITQTLNGAYQETAAVYNAANAEVIAAREAQQKWNEQLAAVGEIIAPAKTAIIELGADALVGLIEGLGLTKTETDMLFESIEKNTGAYNNATKSIEDNVAAKLAETEHTRNLVHELDLLVDENGNVEEKYRNRAEFIMGELNNALGTELQWNRDLRGSLDDLKGSIDEVIKKKQAQILLEAQEEKYAEAIKIKTKALDDQKKAAIALEEAERKLAEAMELGWFSTENVMVLANNVKKAKEAYSSATDTYIECCETEQTYSEATKLALEGNTEGVIATIDKENDARREAVDLAGKTEEEKRNILEAEYDKALTEQQVALDNYEKCQTESNAQQIADAQNHANKVLEEYKAVGGNVGDGFIKGLEEKETRIQQRTNLVVQGIKAIWTGITGFDTHSPSKWSEEIGEWVDDGLANGVAKNANVVKKSFADLFGIVEDEQEALLTEEQYYLDEKARIEKEASEKEYQEKVKAAEKTLEEDKARAKSSKEIKEAEAKYAETIEKLKNESIEKAAEEANKTYLEGLKATADKAKAQRDKIRTYFDELLSEVQDKIKSLNSEMNSFADNIGNVDSLAQSYELLNFEGKVIGDGVELMDLSLKVAELEAFKGYIEQLNEMGIDESMLEEIRGMGLEDGGVLAQALIEATPEQRSKFVEDFKTIGELSGEATAEVFRTEIEGVTEDIKSVFGELNPELLKIGEDWGTVLGQGIIEKLNQTLQNLRSILDFSGGSNGTVYNTQITNNITATPQTSFELSEDMRRTMENLENQAVLA